MIFQYSPFFPPLVLSAVLTGVLAYYGWRNRTNPVSAPFALLMAAVTLWTAGYAFELISVDLLVNQILNTIEYMGIVTVPVAWLLVVLCYTGRTRYITRRNLALLSVVPVLVVLLVATNSYHHLYYSVIIPRIIAGSEVWIFVRGPLFWLHVAYSYLLLLIALILLASRYSGAPAIYRRQIAILGIAAVIPVLVNLLYVASINPVPGLDLTPFTFTCVGVILAIGLFRFQLFFMLPVAYPQIFSAISDGIIVADTRNRILDLNPAARQIAGEPETEMIGQLLTGPFPQLSRFVAGNGCITEDHMEVMIPRDDAPHFYDVVCRQLRVPGQSPTGPLFILRDVTERHMALVVLDTAHKKLNLLSTVTRHDMMNKFTGLLVYADLAKIQSDPEKITLYLQKIDEIARMIQKEIAFTHDYQEMGVKFPVWQDLSMCITDAKSQVDMGGVVVTEACAGLEIYADPLFVKVLINLLDNAVRHGGTRLKTIRVSYRKDGDFLVVTCADDGDGIKESEKHRLFTRGFGKNTGLGLFLVWEILLITGIMIRENGVPGAGARFEITVPPGAFRFNGRT
ncbi:MAG: histidine kinase N-terminal 7TM domain-containing protein [Methanoregula sp.]|jgi:PAS domain S-box-containing protein